MRLIPSFALGTALLMALAAPGAAETSIPATVTVIGEATIQAVPDMATISVGVTTTGAKAAEAMSANSAALRVVLDRLKASGIADADMQTSNLALSPNWVGYDTGAVPTIAGYTASNQLSVRVRALDTLGGVLDAVITDGANTLNGLTFELSEPKPVLDQAREAAVADARARAALLVEAAGGTLGRVVTISENAGYGAPIPMFAKAADAASVPIASGQIGMAASVSMTFEFTQ